MPPKAPVMAVLRKRSTTGASASLPSLFCTSEDNPATPSSVRRLACFGMLLLVMIALLFVLIVNGLIPDYVVMTRFIAWNDGLMVRHREGGAFISDGSAVGDSGQCNIPLFVAVLNDVTNLVSLVESVKSFNVRRVVSCPVHVHVLDNTGCGNGSAIRRRDVTTSQDHQRPYYEKHEHLGGTPSAAVAACQAWFAIKRTLQTLPRRYGVGVSVTSLGDVPISFGSTMNWFLAQTVHRYQQSYFIWAHTDVIVRDSTVFDDLLSLATQLQRKKEPFSYVLTRYDSLCLIHAEVLDRKVGAFDEFMWYFGEVEYMLRAELAGLPMVQLPHDVLKKVDHRGKSSWQTAAGAGAVALQRRSLVLSRFQRMMDVKLRLWKEYYQKKWASEFGIPDIHNTNVTFLRVTFDLSAKNEFSLLDATMTGVAASLGQALRSPQRLTIRGIDFSRGAHKRASALIHSNASDTVPLINQSWVPASMVLYFLPTNLSNAWVDAVTESWSHASPAAASGAHGGTTAVAFPSLRTILREYRLEQVEFFVQPFDVK